MELHAAGLKEQPFRIGGDPPVFFSYAAQEKAWEFFDQICQHNTGLGLFQGPPFSGKSTLIRQYVRQVPEDVAVAVVDGEGANAERLLESILQNFGYQHEFDSVNELMNMVTVFIKHQAANSHAPLLFVENTHAMNPNAMNALCELASVRVQEKCALRIILASDRSIEYIVSAPAMKCTAKRLTGNFHLSPLTIDETSDYLYAKMRHGGCIDPDFVFPDEVCDELYRASGGWPGVLDRLAQLALENASEAPVALEHIEYPPTPKSTLPTVVNDQTIEDTGTRRPGPLMFLTRNGETLKKIRFDGTRLLLGRSEHNDVSIDSKFVSRYHAMIVRHGSSTLLMDLNTANGTFVNSRRVSNQVLVNDDIITLGDYGLKFVDPGAMRHEPVEKISLDDTVIMLALDDKRKVLARENTAILPTQTDVDKQSGGSG